MTDKPPTTADDMRRAVEAYATHLQTIAQIFEDHARNLRLGVRLDVSEVAAAARRGADFPKIMRFVRRTDDSGVLHDAQLMTALDCIGNILTSPNQNGLVLGAMQSGKTTTSLAMQFAGPIVYLLTGRRLYPIYLITSQTSQEDQTRQEIARFLDFYGEVSIVLDDQHRCKIIDYIRHTVDPGFEFSPTINTYRGYVLKEALPDTLIGPRLDDFIHRRAAGDGIRRVADLCRTANSKGFSPVLLIDEPQYGASDRFVENEDGAIERRPCVLVQFFNRIQEALGEDNRDHVFIGFSATPFELHDLSAVWQVRQYLKSTYTGFNFFGGRVIDANVKVTPPRTITFSKLGKEIGIPFLGNVSLSAYGGPQRIFDRFADKIGYDGSQSEYRGEVEAALRRAILKMVEDKGDSPTGICLRLFNNNLRSHRLLEDLRLPKNAIEVIEYYGSEYNGQSVKRAIRERKHPELPFLIVVTNRARMGDAFPREVRWFLEFSQKATDLNALLQGLLGRACGYGKQSTVVMSDENVMLVEDYRENEGDYIYKTSRHSTVFGGYRRGAPTNILRPLLSMDDPMLRKFFARVDKEIVAPHVKHGSNILSTSRVKKGDKKGYRTGPLLRIAEEIGLFDYLERLDVRQRLFPTYPAFRIARMHDEVIGTRDPNRKLTYTLDEDGNCRFTFRRFTGDGSHGGVRSRGLGQRDAKNPNEAGDTLEPQVNLAHDEDYTWYCAGVTLPLVSAVRELRAGDVTFPVAHSPFAKLMTHGERTVAGYPPD